MPVLGDCGWGGVPVEGQRHAECQMRKWGVRGRQRMGDARKYFSIWRCVKAQIWGWMSEVWASLNVNSSTFSQWKNRCLKNAATALPSDNSVKGRSILRNEVSQFRGKATWLDWCYVDQAPGLSAQIFLFASGSPGRECYILHRRQLYLRSGSIYGVGMGYLVPWLDRIASLQINDFCDWHDPLSQAPITWWAQPIPGCCFLF